MIGIGENRKSGDKKRDTKAMAIFKEKKAASKQPGEDQGEGKRSGNFLWSVDQLNPFVRGKKPKMKKKEDSKWGVRRPTSQR